MFLLNNEYKECSSSNISKGTVSCSLFKRKYLYPIGYINITTQGYEYIIIDIDNKENKRKIMFNDNYKAIIWVHINQIKKNNFHNPYHPTLLNIGYIGEGEYTSRNDIGEKTKEYILWSSMLRRCYNIKNKDYKYYGGNNISVCDKWFNFNNFSKWINNNLPNIEGIKFELDKDLLQQNKINKVYSPETCIFLPEKINSFLAYRDTEYTGTHYSTQNRNYISRGYDFYTNKREVLGIFSDQIMAHSKYLEHKNIQINCAKEYMSKLGIYSEDIIKLIK